MWPSWCYIENFHLPNDRLCFQNTFKFCERMKGNKKNLNCHLLSIYLNLVHIFRLLYILKRMKEKVELFQCASETNINSMYYLITFLSCPPHCWEFGNLSTLTWLRKNIFSFVFATVSFYFHNWMSLNLLLDSNPILRKEVSYFRIVNKIRKSRWSDDLKDPELFASLKH